MRLVILFFVSLLHMGCESTNTGGLVGTQPLLKNCSGKLAVSEMEHKNEAKPTPWCISMAAWPPDAWESKIEGFVVVKYSVFKNGAVGNVVVMESEPKGVFEESAVASVKNSFYMQGQRDYHDQTRRLIFAVPEKYKNP